MKFIENPINTATASFLATATLGILVYSEFLRPMLTAPLEDKIYYLERELNQRDNELNNLKGNK